MTYELARTSRPAPRWWHPLRAWLDGHAAVADGSRREDHIQWLRVLPFLALHSSCLLVFVVGVSPIALSVCAALFFVRMFALTAFYHRYFGHRAFQASRPAQFAFAIAGASCAQRGPLWWAAHHRRHHKFADTARDEHRPGRGFLWSHLLWFWTRDNFRTDFEQVRDFAAFPELRWLDRYAVVVPLALAGLLFVAGEALAAAGSATGGSATDGLQLVVWGFSVSTVLLFHATSTVNSLAHRFGSRPYATRDESRNNPWLALLTLGEGWHNNHHRYPVAARQGFRWWQIDITYYGLRALAALGVIRALRPVPARVLAEAKRRRP